MLRIEILTDRVDERSGKISRGERAGEDYHIRQQEGWAHNGKAYPERFMFSLGRDRPPYPPGTYQVAPASFEVGEYDRLQFSRELVLLREAEQGASKPAPAKAA